MDDLRGFLHNLIISLGFNSIQAQKLWNLNPGPLRFKPMTSAIQVKCSNQLSYEATAVGSRSVLVGPSCQRYT